MSAVRRVDDYKDSVIKAVIEELHIEVTAMAVDVEAAPISPISSLCFGISVKDIDEPLVAKILISPATCSRCKVTSLLSGVEIVKPSIL